MGNYGVFLCQKPAKSIIFFEISLVSDIKNKRKRCLKPILEIPFHEVFPHKTFFSVDADFIPLFGFSEAGEGLGGHAVARGGHDGHDSTLRRWRLSDIHLGAKGVNHALAVFCTISHLAMASNRHLSIVLYFDNIMVAISKEILTYNSILVVHHHILSVNIPGAKVSGTFVMSPKKIVDFYLTFFQRQTGIR